MFASHGGSLLPHPPEEGRGQDLDLMSPLSANVYKCPQDSPGGSHTGEKAKDAPWGGMLFSLSDPLLRKRNLWSD